MLGPIFVRFVPFLKKLQDPPTDTTHQNLCDKKKLAKAANLLKILKPLRFLLVSLTPSANLDIQPGTNESNEKNAEDNSIY